ncbi:Stk1 family PASTA domain-containing Ser/Thr kinase [Bacillus sp. 03113]|uniref:Stk1 family PASTA domain-containing Ser/Thr kinase n=1 Tax=Bacillus sp. 03113 TaxID=2578211 RepID=UPI001142E886|nr:Stk1 family PASTA domain-containing Ser/Thr kinase [Bacillus sp. 03113]
MMIGKRISGRYRILDMVGGGGMANVYLAHDMILDRDVAVKMLRLDFANDEEFIRRFHREAQSATSLVHPNIVGIYDVGEEDSIYYIVMEYVDGQTLKQYIQQNSPINIDEALNIMRQLTSAISHAHQNHIIHRDIKPQNILIDHNGNVKITDFGIALALSATSITQTNSVLGSVHYLSPEQARGGMANKKSDIYSLGIVMFELLTGRLPFSGESAISIALKHLQSETPSLRRWNPLIPQSVENIVLKATAKDPFRRYTSVDEMDEDLWTALDPSRMDEEKFIVPIDDEVTKAVPIITNDQEYPNLDETIVHGKGTKPFKPYQGESKKSQQEKKPKKRNKMLIILFTSLLIVATLSLLAFTLLPEIMAPKEIKVPDVSHMTTDKAITKLQSNGFIIGKTIQMNDEYIDAGKIIRTNPSAGKFVDEGTEISLYESKGKEKFELSDYRSRQFEDVEALLDEQNFRSIRTKEVFDENQSPGTILEQSFSKGDQVVPEETDLEFTISKGPELIRLKDLKGNSRQAVNEYANLTGLNIRIASEEYSDQISEGFVISQSPEPGTNLKKGSDVSVVISKGKNNQPKQVNEDITIPYEPSVEGQAQQVQIFIEDANRDITEPAETFTITETTQKRIQLTIPYGGQAEYKVIRDQNVIIDKVVQYQE